MDRLTAIRRTLGIPSEETKTQKTDPRDLALRWLREPESPTHAAVQRGIRPNPPTPPLFDDCAAQTRIDHPPSAAKNSALAPVVSETPSKQPPLKAVAFTRPSAPTPVLNPEDFPRTKALFKADPELFRGYLFLVKDAMEKQYGIYGPHAALKIIRNAGWEQTLKNFVARCEKIPGTVIQEKKERGAVIVLPPKKDSPYLLDVSAQEALRERAQAMSGNLERDAAKVLMYLDAAKALSLEVIKGKIVTSGEVAFSKRMESGSVHSRDLRESKLARILDQLKREGLVVVKDELYSLTPLGAGVRSHC